MNLSDQTPLTNPILAAIVARSTNYVIGRDGDLPWRLRSDLQHFKRVTLGKPCLMGRKTWESLPFPLPGRPNLVLTRDADYRADGAELFTDMAAMVGRGAELAGSLGVEEVMIIGGAQIYATLMPWIGRIYETEVDAIIDGDAHFPELSDEIWDTRDELHHLAGKGDDFAFKTRILDRRLTANPS
jgi:dihydrofolate reductase